MKPQGGSGIPLRPGNMPDEMLARLNAGSPECVTLRFSPGHFTTEEQIEKAADALKKALQMSRERIGKTLIILVEEEAQVQRLAQQTGKEAIYQFIKEVIAKRVEAAPRMRCG